VDALVDAPANGQQRTYGHKKTRQVVDWLTGLVSVEGATSAGTQ
jgi:hypothetical protein